MQLLLNTEILQPRQISRGKTTRADLAGFSMTNVGSCTNIRVLTHPPEARPSRLAVLTVCKPAEGE
jgi:hypothetical protein